MKTRHSRIRRILISMLSFVAGTEAVSGQVAQLPPYRHRVLGVYDASTGEPIEGVGVADVASGTIALTTKTGTVSLVFLPDGGSQLRIRKMGYAPVVQFVAISPSDTVPVTIVLTPTPTSLPAMVRTDSGTTYFNADLRGFEERRKSGPGHFISEAELRKSDNRKMQDIVTRLPGMQVKCTKAFPNECYAVSFRAQSRYAILGGVCTYTLYIDGMLSLDNDLTKFNVRDYAGIEAYIGPATIPLKYNTGGNVCGVLLFWTREK